MGDQVAFNLVARCPIGISKQPEKAKDRIAFFGR